MRYDAGLICSFSEVLPSITTLLAF